MSASSVFCPADSQSMAELTLISGNFVVLTFFEKYMHKLLKLFSTTVQCVLKQFNRWLYGKWRVNKKCHCGNVRNQNLAVSCGRRGCLTVFKSQVNIHGDSKEVNK